MTKQNNLLVVLVLLVAVSAACSNPNPIAPGGGTPPNGTVTITYQELGGESNFCNRQYFPVRAHSLSWPDGSSVNAVMADNNGTGTFSVQVLAPAGRLRLQIIDSCLCPPDQSGCVGPNNTTGKRISVNGVRLTDGETETSFGFVPPDSVTR